MKKLLTLLLMIGCLASHSFAVNDLPGPYEPTMIEISAYDLMGLDYMNQIKTGYLDCTCCPSTYMGYPLDECMYIDDPSGDYFRCWYGFFWGPNCSN